MQYSLKKDYQHLRWQQQKSWILFQDAVSAHTKFKMEDAPTVLKIPKSECPVFSIRLPRHKWPKSWSSMEDPVVPLERDLYGHPLAGLLGTAVRESFLEIRLGKNFQIGNVHSYTVKKGNYTKSQRREWMIINVQKEMDQLESYLLFAHNIFWNVYIWHALVDLIFYGLWINLFVR